MPTKVANKTNLNVKIDTKLKKEADAVFKDMGLTLSSAITMFLKRSVDDRQLPFQPRVTSELDRAMDEIKSGNVETFDSIADWKKDTLKNVQD
ncbi:type II toxin-antitoxin system RelB/DinJ family antitoxin [Lactobacillus sp. ESL0701]|uniref:type II toxin-antitoxin system RelB/DinJ family antitoxin n=1 Tax=Lactobacillus sp. ESL0701 TaxID=2983217 RepID=UPI0023F821DF|nr:type II toxin-antitoxin system RelB/DinJ family antitoxin [Lactobacillus sp. ESL0701]MDF7672493.1 type II toxin-antitoxin system RelB/DinJ family antitoxin [Lactobacillus sp. ESL0701]